MATSRPRGTLTDPIAEARRQWVAHGWEDAAAGMTAVTSVVRVRQILVARAERALKPFGITFSRYELLALLMFSRTGALPMSRASARLQVHPASVTNTVDRLVADGLVERRPDPNDGRGSLVAITDQGMTLVHTATPHLNAVFTDLGITPEECNTLFDICARLRLAEGDIAAQE